MSTQVKVLVAAAVVALAVYFSIPQGIWYAAKVYEQNTINGKIAAVKAENERVRQENEKLKAAQAPIQAPIPTATPAAPGGS